MTEPTPASRPSSPRPEATARPGRRLRPWLGAFLLVAWVSVVQDPMKRAHDAGGASGWLGLAAFAVGSLALAGAALLPLWGLRHRSFHRARSWYLLLGLGASCIVVALVTRGVDGLQMTPFLLVAIALGFRWQVGITVVAPVSIALWIASVTLPSWGITRGMVLGVFASGAGAALGRFSAERDRTARAMTAHAHELEIAEERNRMARDLHDILGHSLTVVAMKAELAEHLVEADPDAARAELREVQSITRSALADVRATVNNYRELSLAGEIARAASTLRSAGVKADLPPVIDEVPVDLRELFAWALREGVTNVVRHSGARHCRVSVTPASMLVVDDGSGGARASDGNGLVGLRQRAEGHGARVVTGPSPAGTPDRPGFSLLVTTEGVHQ